MNINYCTETERDVLAGLITNSNQLIRNKKILHSDLFHAPEHSSIYEEITRQLDEERRVSPDSMRNKFDQLGWTDRKGNKISDLIAAICVSPPEADEISELIVQLVELDYQRKGKTACTKIQNILDENLSLPEKFDQIQRTFAEGMRIPVSQGEKPTKIWEGYIEQKEYDAAHPEEKEIIGYDWPYPTVTDIYGKLRRGCVHVIVSRGGVGKSTMVSLSLIHI